MTELVRDTLYTVIAQIPSGKVASYGQLAILANAPGRARWVGKQLSQLPQDSTLPWHRVLNAQGLITCPQRDLAVERLRHEGVTVTQYRVNLSRFGWSPGS